ncbi:MAG: hypothetical protein GXO74_12410 [Calditrichaeota bacterium]|nr:hypothetical protein [Calditrichota bacterium]
MKKKLAIYTIFAILFVAPNLCFSQNGLSLGIGGMTAISRGVESVHWNPANLAFADPNRPNFEMIIYSLNARGGNNSFSFDDINKYIGDGESIYLTETDVKNILNLIPKSGMVFDFTGNVSLLSFSYKNFGFGIESQMFGHFSVPKDLYENLLYKIGRDVYDYSVNGGGQGLIKFKFSYGRRLIDRIIFDVPGLKNTVFKEIAWGASLALVQGVGYANVEKGMAKLSITNSGILPRAEFATRTATFGKGISLDLGLSSYTNNGWQIGMVLENLLGSVFWDRGAQFSRASLDLGNEPLFIFGKGQLGDINADSVTVDTTYSIDGFSKRIPLSFRVGIAKNIKRYLLNMEFDRTDGISQFSFGGGVKFSVFRCYASVGRRLSNFQWSIGGALDFKRFYFDLGVSSRGGITLGSSRALSLGTSMKFGF